MRPASSFLFIQLSNARADAAARKLFSLAVSDCGRIPGGGYGREEKNGDGFVNGMISDREWFS